MDTLEKALIRLDHWIHHNEHHQEEYELFADQLDKEGKKECGDMVRKAAELTSQGTDALRKALEILK
ncbi:hypothetical protein [Dethiosulfatarculus sandiegensis]|uniref:DUF8180 domain-containing protein n=1 Tax=Dethiosulfatarculus sandiegensis TaxID=1429043 RepID=A0A0D2JSY4_9BACT|nr:hypothetical protein [Dethiosulfatarculus sandiegensis]KIX12575.1 hypothetical protein X474_18395 [Dethiosulfatarculus sandiegensis]